MSYDDLITNVKNKLRSLDMITVNNIQSRYHVLQGDARRAIKQLQDEGLVGGVWDPGLGGYPVIKQEMKA